MILPKTTAEEAVRSSTPLLVGLSEVEVRTVHGRSTWRPTQPWRPLMPPITFTDDNFKGVDYRQDDLMVVLIDINKFTIMKTLVDQGSSVDILY